MSQTGMRLTVHIGEEVIGPDPPDLADASCGAIATFRGVVRGGEGARRVTAIDYECYREMAERAIANVLEEEAARYGLRAAHVVHRVGNVRAGEASVLVAVACAHRGEAFDAVRAIIDAIKARAPIWKKEHYADGTSRWL